MTTKMKCRVAAPDDDVHLDIRLGNEQVARVALSRAEPGMLDEAIPWRTFRIYFGQTHRSGAYWSATEAAHVIYESQVELSRLLLADFDADVTHIVAQPFLMRAVVGGVRRRHIPDYFLITSNGPVVVDVKPRHRLDDPKVVDTFAWVRAAVETKGWTFEVASEPPPILVENVRFLAKSRRRPYVSSSALDELRGLDLDGVTIGDALRQVTTSPQPSARAALLHMLWSHEVSTNLHAVLDDRSVLTVEAAR
jgi:hypothetical protein